MVKSWRRLIALMGSGIMMLTLASLLYQGVTGKGILPHAEYFAKHTEKAVIWLSPSDKLWNLDAMDKLFVTLGLAGSIVPAVYESRNRRVKGILIHDMTKYFFPLHGIVMLENLLLSISGQICAAMDIKPPIKYFLAGSVLSVLYATALILGTGLNDTVTKLYIRGYVKDHISLLKASPQCKVECCNKCVKNHDYRIRTKRAKFLNSLATHIAQQISSSGTPFCITEKGTKREIRQIFQLITHQNIKTNKELKNSYGYIDSFDSVFKLCDESIEINGCADAVFFELPVSDKARNDFASQVEASCTFWQIVLESMNDVSVQAKAACRIIYTLVFNNGRLKDNYMIATCGLLTCLYKKWHGKVTTNELHEIDFCAMFVDQMIGVFREEANYLDDPTSGLNGCLKICTDLLFTIWVISEVEMYSTPRLSICSQVPEAIDRLLFGERGYVATSIQPQHNTDKYLSIAYCLIKQLPSVACKAVTMEQKRELRKYILGQIRKTGDKMK